MSISSPSLGGTSALKDCLIFVCEREPKLEEFDMFNNWTVERYDKYVPSKHTGTMLCAMRAYQ